MHGKLHGGHALRAILIALLGLGLASADDEPAQIAQPDFAIYHTKYVHRFSASRPLEGPSQILGRSTVPSQPPPYYAMSDAYQCAGSKYWRRWTTLQRPIHTS